MTLSILLAGLIAQAGSSAAQTPAAPTPPALVAEQLEFFNGTWNCTGTSDGTMTQKPELGGWWYAVRFEQKKSKTSPQPYLSTSMLGYDTSRKLFTRTDFDNRGALVRITSKGWQGDSWVWEGTITSPERSGEYRQTLSRVAGTKNEFTARSEMNGKVYIEMTCKRAR